MLNTLRLSFSLKNTYRVNAILHSLKQIPLLKHLLSNTLYQVRGLKIFANVLTVIWELITIFLFKFLYFFVMVCGLELIRPDLQSKETFLHILLLLTLIALFVGMVLFVVNEADRVKNQVIMQMVFIDVSCQNKLILAA